MRTRNTHKQKLYYIFFAMRGKYDGKYAQIFATSFVNARLAAYEIFGNEVADIDNREEYCNRKIKLYKLKEIQAKDLIKKGE